MVSAFAGLRSYAPAPHVGVSPDELPQESCGLVQVQARDFHPVPERQVKFVPHWRVLRLPDDDPGYAELDDGPGAHVTGHELGAHAHPPEAACVVEAVDLGPDLGVGADVPGPLEPPDLVVGLGPPGFFPDAGLCRLPALHPFQTDAWNCWIESNSGSVPWGETGNGRSPSFTTGQGVPG